MRGEKFAPHLPLCDADNPSHPLSSTVWQALLPSGRAAAKRGVLFTVLGLLLCEPNKVLSRASLTERMLGLGLRAGKQQGRRGGASASAADDDDADEDSVLPTWPELLKEFLNNE